MVGWNGLLHRWPQGIHQQSTFPALTLSASLLRLLQSVNISLIAPEFFRLSAWRFDARILLYWGGSVYSWARSAIKTTDGNLLTINKTRRFPNVLVNKVFGYREVFEVYFVWNALSDISPNSSTQHASECHGTVCNSSPGATRYLPRLWPIFDFFSVVQTCSSVL